MEDQWCLVEWLQAYENHGRVEHVQIHPLFHVVNSLVDVMITLLTKKEEVVSSSSIPLIGTDEINVNIVLRIIVTLLPSWQRPKKILCHTPLSVMTRSSSQVMSNYCRDRGWTLKLLVVWRDDDKVKKYSGYKSSFLWHSFVHVILRDVLCQYKVIITVGMRR